MRRIMLVPTLLLLLLGLTSVAYASGPPQSTDGSFTVDIAGATGEQRGSLCFINLSATFNFSGDLNGSAPMDFRIVQKAPCEEEAPQLFAARGTYEGSVDAAGTTAEGTFDLVFLGSIDADHNAQGKLIVLNGSGGLDHLRGYLSLQGLAGVSGTYDGVMYFGRR